jgi:CubicO group peptidase (beta-lactamase class C family)
MRHRTWLSAIAVVFVACAVAPADESESKPDLWRQVDAVFETWNKWDVPGAALAVVRDGEIVYSRGYGSAQLEYQIPITPATVFHVASVSKQFTCFAIVLLAEEGKLALDDDIRKHLPDLPEFPQPITIRHLCHHTSGLRDQWELLALGGWRLDDVITRDHILKMVRRQRELNFAPGSEYLYSNTGYTLLAEIVAKVSGKSFAEFTEERIFKPLAMSRTHFHDDHERIVPGRAYSYSGSEGAYRNSVLSYANVGATSLFTTAEDLCRWLVNLDDGRVGGAAAIDAMHNRGTLNNGKSIDYALGLMHSKHRGLEIVAHSGGDAGFRSYAMRVPAHRLGVVVLSNLASFNPEAAANRVVELVLADKLEPESESKDSKPPAAGPAAVEVAPEVLDRYVGKFHLDVGALVTFSRQGSKLLGQLAGQQPFELVGRSDTEFVVRDLGAQVVFDTADGPAPGLQATLAGQKIRGKRVVDEQPPDLEPLAGDYYSPEVDTVYTLVVVDGKLVARHQRHPDIPLTPLGSDKFLGDQWFFSAVTFERGEDGQATGFRVGGGRVRDLRFDKRPTEGS